MSAQSADTGEIRDEYREYLDELFGDERLPSPRSYAVSFKIEHDADHDTRYAKFMSRVGAASHNGQFWCGADCLVVVASTLPGDNLGQYLHDRVLDLSKDFIAVIAIADQEFYTPVRLDGPALDTLCGALGASGAIAKDSFA
ncbi:hypothetical protein [Microvirga massiliensis]|uniref:hypothetical protein n=1 Tax=Microvirga massiliensis TaxID=1033741 RepID=UPI00062B947A|nr:hypothetical protein [Microvirga massiliensis]